MNASTLIFFKFKPLQFSMKQVHRERREKARRTSSNGHHSSGMLIKEQSQSVLRGEHPIAFVLPTVRYLLTIIQ